MEIIGVGFLLFAKNGWKTPRFFTVRELENKPQYHKCAGMKSFPFETYEIEDGNFGVTIRRLLIEEIGISPNQVDVLGVERQVFHLIPGKPDIKTFYGYGIFHGDPYQDFQPKENDVEFYGWETIDRILKEQVRVEVPSILTHFGENNFHKVLAKF